MSKNLFSVCAAGALFVSFSASALTSDREATTRHPVHKHHLAHYKPRATMTDAPTVAAPDPATDVKPENPAEYFGHATGSDGSMPQ